MLSQAVLDVCVSLAPHVDPGVVEEAERLSACITWDRPSYCSGPPAGLLAGHRMARSRGLLYLGVDHPFLWGDVLSTLWRTAARWGLASVTLLGPDCEPLFTVGYASSRALNVLDDLCQLGVLRARLSSLYRIQSALLVPWHMLVPEPHKLVNINKPDAGEPSLVWGKCEFVEVNHTYYERAIKELQKGRLEYALGLLGKEKNYYASLGLTRLAKHVEADMRLVERLL